MSNSNITDSAIPAPVARRGRPRTFADNATRQSEYRKRRSDQLAVQNAEMIAALMSHLPDELNALLEDTNLLNMSVLQLAQKLAVVESGGLYVIPRERHGREKLMWETQDLDELKARFAAEDAERELRNTQRDVT